MRASAWSDPVFRWLCLTCAALCGLLMVAFFVQLAFASGDAWARFGLGFFVSSEWDPVRDLYGAFPAIAGTVATTVIALVIALPLAFVSALFIVDAPPWLSRVLGQAVDLLAAIPSIIYGMWGLFVLVPLMDRLWVSLGVDNEYGGIGLLTASLILALMILPYICAVMRDVFGLLGGIFIGLGRALGETMAVLFVAGNIMKAPTGLLDGCTTIAATLANNFAEAEGIQRSALFALGLILLVMAFAIQVLAQYYLRMTSAKRGEK